MNYRYKLNESVVQISEDVTKLYGISCFDNNKEISVLSAICKNKEQVEELIERCNRYELDPIQLEDVVEDYLT